MKFSQNDFPAFGEPVKGSNQNQNKKVYQKKFQPKNDEEESKSSLQANLGNDALGNDSLQTSDNKADASGNM